MFGWIELLSTAGTSSECDSKAESGREVDLGISGYSVKEFELDKIQTYRS